MYTRNNALLITPAASVFVGSCENPNTIAGSEHDTDAKQVSDRLDSQKTVSSLDLTIGANGFLSECL